MNLTQPHAPDPTPTSIQCPFMFAGLTGPAQCPTSGSIPGIRRHVSSAHGLSKTDRDALVNSALTAAGLAHLISATKRTSDGGKIATAVHWAETLPDTELRKAARKLGLFLPNAMPREEVIEKVKERAERKGIMAVPSPK